jgi:glycosyltransferase involved in cell wall biosynthesis
LLHTILVISKKLPNAILVLAGDGPDTPRLKKIAQALGIVSHVKFLGFIPYSIMPHLVMRAQVCLLPFGNQGLQLWEWCAAGKAIVAMDSENLRLHGFIHLQNAYLAKDENDFVKGVLLILTNSQIKTRLAKGSTELVRNRDWNYLSSILFRRLMAIVNLSKEHLQNADS